MTWFSTPIALGIDTLIDRKPIFQPDDLSPNPNETEVPDGYLAPLAEDITSVPSHPDQQEYHYGAEPNGETLPPKVVDIITK